MFVLKQFDYILLEHKSQIVKKILLLFFFFFSNKTSHLIDLIEDGIFKSELHLKEFQSCRFNLKFDSIWNLDWNL